LAAGFEKLADRMIEFQVAQTAIDRFEIQVVPRLGAERSLDESIRSVMAAEFPGAAVQVAMVERIPRSAAGKRKQFVRAMSP
jgi:hypothetical protein